MVTRAVACPSCDAKLRVPGTVPAGKRIKCPKCETAFSPPPVGEPTAPADEVDSRDDRPARRKPRKKASAGKAPLVLGVVAGVVLLIGAGVGAAVALRPKKTPARPPSPTKPP